MRELRDGGRRLTLEVLEEAFLAALEDVSGERGSPPATRSGSPERPASVSVAHAGGRVDWRLGIQRAADSFAGGWTGSGIVRAMPPIAPTFTPLEWRQLAHACQVVTEQERARAAAVGGAAAHGFLISADVFERLAARCLEMTQPE